MHSSVVFMSSVDLLIFILCLLTSTFESPDLNRWDMCETSSHALLLASCLLRNVFRRFYHFSGICFSFFFRLKMADVSAHTPVAVYYITRARFGEEIRGEKYISALFIKNDKCLFLFSAY